MIDHVTPADYMTASLCNRIAEALGLVPDAIDGTYVRQAWNPIAKVVGLRELTDMETPTLAEVNAAIDAANARLAA